MSQEPQPQNSPSATPASGPEPAGSGKKKPVSRQWDWRPLGTIRDSFAEQIKQDKDW